MSKRIYLLASAILLAIATTTVALAAGVGDPLRGGVRNPGTDQSQELTSETEVIANTSTYGTRQSNKSNNGGGAIYGCRSAAGGTPTGNEPCIRSSNLSAGFAFEFSTDGNQAGTINVGNGGDGARPFTTNATGVATGLNADRVGSMTAAQIIAAAAAQSGSGNAAGAPAAKLPPFAQITSAGALGGGSRDATGSQRLGPGRYRVTFRGDLGNCAVNATPITTTTSTVSAVVDVAGDKQTTAVEVRVATFSTTGAGSTANSADETVHVAVTC